MGVRLALLSRGEGWAERKRLVHAHRPSLCRLEIHEPGAAITQPLPDDQNKDGVDDVREFSYVEAEDKWVLFNNGSWATMKSSIIDPDDPCQRIETRLHREWRSGY